MMTLVSDIISIVLKIHGFRRVKSFTFYNFSMLFLYSRMIKYEKQKAFDVPSVLKNYSSCLGIVEKCARFRFLAELISWGYCNIRKQFIVNQILTYS